MSENGARSGDMMDRQTILAVIVIVVVLLGGCTAPMTSSPDDPDTEDPDTAAEDHNGTAPTGPPPGPGQLLEETNTTGEG